MRRVAMVISVVVAALATTCTAAFAQGLDFAVPVTLGARSFGAFAEGTGNDPGALRAALGAPSIIVGSCVMRWSSLGVTATLGTYGQDIDPCTAGYFIKARLSDRRWHTTNGVHPGSSAARARRKAKGRRCDRTCGARVHGYVLGLHRSECAMGLFPRVIAEVRGRRVRALLVLTSVCE